MAPMAPQTRRFFLLIGTCETMVGHTQHMLSKRARVGIPWRAIGDEAVDARLVRSAWVDVCKQDKVYKQRGGANVEWVWARSFGLWGRPGTAHYAMLYAAPRGPLALSSQIFSLEMAKGWGAMLSLGSTDGRCLTRLVCGVDRGGLRLCPVRLGLLSLPEIRSFFSDWKPDLRN